MKVLITKEIPVYTVARPDRIHLCQAQPIIITRGKLQGSPKGEQTYNMERLTMDPHLKLRDTYCDRLSYFMQITVGLVLIARIY